MAENRLHCVVVTPETTVFDEAVDFVALPLFDGELGILPGRTSDRPLRFGELRTVISAATKRYYIDGGFAQVRDDVVTILTSNALPAEKVDRVAAADSLAKAQLIHPSTEAAFADRDRMLERSRLRFGSPNTKVDIPRPSRADSCVARDFRSPA